MDLILCAWLRGFIVLVDFLDELYMVVMRMSFQV